MIFGSVCSGIEAASMAWVSLGWEPVFHSEIEKFPRAVLEHHYPDVPLHGDFTTIGANEYGPIDLLVGGTPCQSFSIAGLRKGLDDERGNLSLEYLKLAQRQRPRWLVWENVPGILSSNKGRDFGSFLGALVELGYGFAYRVLDAQYFGIPQRRRRVFVIGYLGDWRPASTVLFERESLQGHPAPSRETREDVASTVESNVARPRGDGSRENLIMASGQANAEITKGHAPALNCNRDGAPILFQHIDVIAFSYKDDGQGAADNLSPTLCAMGGKRANGGGQRMAVAFAQNTRDEVREMDVVGALSASPGMKQQSYIRDQFTVRRLTVTECERLQGFPDDYTRIAWRNKSPDDCPDGPRYKALGNSMAVPCMRWIGERIQMVDDLCQ